MCDSIITIIAEVYIIMVNFLPSQATTPITVSVLEVATILSIVAPASVNQGQSFIIEGTLKRADTLENLDGANISLSYNGVDLGTVMTRLIEGSIKYQAVVQINESGSFNLMASFAGISGFMGSDALRGISISRFVVSSVLLIPVIVGVLVAYLSGKK